MTPVAWGAYALGLSVLLSPAAWLLDRGLGRFHLPTRWAWLGVLALLLILPAVAPLRAPDPAAVTIPAEPAPIPVAEAPGVDLDRARERVWSLAEVLGLVYAVESRLDRALLGMTDALGARPRARFWLGIGWGAASLLLALVLASSMVLLARRRNRWPPQTLLGRAVRVSPDLGPATVGLLRPEIVVPRWSRKLGPEELELVLKHEEEHARSRDPLVRALALLPLVLYPWNPLIWWQVRRLGDAVEVDCDRRVLRRGVAARSYGDLLVSLGSRAGQDLLPVPTMSSAPSLLERRLTAMKETRPRNAIPTALGATAAALLLVAVACGTEPPAGAGADRSLVPDPEREVANIWVGADGTVTVDGEPHALDDVSEVLGALSRAMDGTLVVSVAGEQEVSYQTMDRLQQEVVAAGVTRVVFAGPDTPERGFSRAADASAVARAGLAIALPEQGEGRLVSQRNLLHLIVQPDGLVDVRRGESRRVQRYLPEDVEGLWRREAPNNPDLIAAVKTHPDAEHRHTMRVLDALQRADARRISLQVLQLPPAEPEPPATQSQERRISVAWRDTPIRTVLAAFSAFSARSITAADGVEAPVTLEIDDLPWDVALRSIADDHRLVVTEDAEGNIVLREID